MTTHITYKPHYCDRRYGEYVADNIYNMKLFGIPRSFPILSTAVVGKLNSFLIPEDSSYLCNGAFELYPVYYRKSKAKTITMMKELTFWRLETMSSYKREFIKRLFLTNKGIITDTRLMKRFIIKHIDLPVEIVNPFCAQPFLENKPNIRAKNIIFIGSFESPTKGYGNLIEAFRLLRNDDKGWKLYMVGKRGTDFVSRNVPGMSVTNQVPSIKPYLAKCSIYVHPADFEPFGITVLEAMSAGVIPIVTCMTGSSEVLEDNKLSNLIIENNTPKIIENKIEEVYNYSTAKKRSISDKCKKIVKTNYLEKTGLEDFKKAFDRLLEN